MVLPASAARVSRQSGHSAGGRDGRPAGPRGSGNRAAGDHRTPTSAPSAPHLDPLPLQQPLEALQCAAAWLQDQLCQRCHQQRGVCALCSMHQHAALLPAGTVSALPAAPCIGLGRRGGTCSPLPVQALRSQAGRAEGRLNVAQPAAALQPTQPARGCVTSAASCCRRDKQSYCVQPRRVGKAQGLPLPYPATAGCSGAPPRAR